MKKKKAKTDVSVLTKRKAIKGRKLRKKGLSRKQNAASVKDKPLLHSNKLPTTVHQNPQIDEIFNILHPPKMTTGGSLSQSAQGVGEFLGAKSPPVSGDVPLKKPRSERMAFLMPPSPGKHGQGNTDDQETSAAPARASCGKKKRRKMKLVKKKKKQNEEAVAAVSSETKLESARFRYLNEQLYTKTGFEALKMFSKDREAFDAYHQGFRNQVARWPVNPLDLIIQNVNKMPPSHLVVDLGCGDARLATAVRQRVLSFDLVATNDRVTACDMAHVPLPDGAANVAVLCLALMGTNLADFVTETNRLLRMGGQLRIAEVASRFDSVDDFVRDMNEYGFCLISQDLSHQFFYLFSMRKTASVDRKRKDLPDIKLKPCLYKRR